MAVHRWIHVIGTVGVLATTGCVMGGADGELEEDGELAQEGDDHIEDVLESDDPGKADTFGDFFAEYTLSVGINPLRQLDYPNIRMFDGHRCTRSIARSGCAVAAHAMLMDYYGAPSSIPEHSTNLHVGSPHGHSSCLLNWHAGLAPGVTYRGVGSGSMSAIKRELDDGSPVVAHVSRTARGRCHHFVLVTGYSRNGSARADFEILDPATGSHRNLSAYAKVCSTRLFDGTPQP